ncbi:hypothetical protein GCM10010497_58440 [Streptomyces cinereoruber]|uniref:Uncharacterized protein n=1 Tax=Streptomyces cinereoruber TaxID=67260 RepID=A0AAV4KQ82_9ACTN|nr:hypothetical protein [Streptomyces cinereoruber]MBB4161803.1 ferredoxin [Streptomyces cinereoruber]NIH65488.1 ferredoxin [Streptomyces cinereoruber]GGR47418.1 hypothetical protein GCM10010497_58440 [Streptomyces cinereoruber]
MVRQLCSVGCLCGACHGFMQAGYASAAQYPLSKTARELAGLGRQLT